MPKAMLDMLFVRTPFRSFKGGEMIPFSPGVNLLVGDQGSGKSTILEAIASLGGVQKSFWKKDSPAEYKKAFILVPSESTGPFKVFAHDYENDSPRTAPSLDLMGMLPVTDVFSMKNSHGESTNRINSRLSQASNMLLILDEPDSGLSNRSALALADILKGCAERDCQVIASVHHPWIIEAFPRVYSVEHADMMDSDKFLATQRQPNATPSK